MENLERKLYYKKIGVYRIYSKFNNKSYIGSSSNLYSRINLHVKELENNKHHSPPLQNHYNKYGKHDLILEIICFCSKNELYQLELNNIIKYDSFRTGFNCLEFPGSFIGYIPTEEQLLKFKNIQKLNAVKYREGLLKNLEKARLAKLKYPSIRPTWLFEREVTKETRLKMSNAAKKRGVNHNKIVIQKDKNNIFINEFESALEAQRKTGIACTNIGKCCLGERKTAGKYKWSFKN